MKRILVILIASGMVLFIRPFTIESAASPIPVEKDAGQNYAPGSIVQFEHLNSENGLSQNVVPP